MPWGRAIPCTGVSGNVCKIAELLPCCLASQQALLTPRVCPLQNSPGGFRAREDKKKQAPCVRGSPARCASAGGNGMGKGAEGERSSSVNMLGVCVSCGHKYLHVLLGVRGCADALQA